MKKIKIKIIITALLIFVCAGDIYAQRTLSDITNHFDSICMNCNNAQSDQIIYKACKDQDSMISQKREWLLLRLKNQRYAKDDSLYISIVSGFDKLVEIGNTNKKNVIAVLRSSFSGSMLSSQAGLLTYYLNEQTIDLLNYYVEINTE